MDRETAHEQLLAEYVSKLLCVKQWYLMELDKLPDRVPGRTLVQPPAQLGEGDARLSFSELLSPFGFGLSPTVANGLTLYRTIRKEFDGLGSTFRDGQNMDQVFYEDWFNPTGDPVLGRLFPAVENEERRYVLELDEFGLVDQTESVHTESSPKANGPANPAVG